MKSRSQIGRSSRIKGKAYEREVAKALREYGYDTRRSQQYCGADGDGDVIGLDGIHIECKRREKSDFYGWMKQSKDEKLDNELPTVFYRKSHEKSLVIMELDDWMKLYNAYNKTLERKSEP
jgi:Holliday junction resolvase